MEINVFCPVNFRQVLFEIIDSGLVEDFQITFVKNFTILRKYAKKKQLKHLIYKD
jgi:hypothetical protein